MSAARRKHGSRKTVSRGKIISIAMLGCLFVGVWANALLGGSDHQPASVRRSRSARPVASNRAQPGRETTQPAARAKAPADWPTMSLPEAARNDPFGKPGWALSETAPEAKPAALVTTMVSAKVSPQQLQDAGTSMIVISGGEKIATIGDLEVRIGDTVCGYKVVDITPQGVVLDTAGKATN